MSKIAVILSSNTHWAPYYSRYVNELKSIGVQFDFIIWNRENIDETSSSKGCNLIEYRLKDNTNNGSFLKVFKFVRYALFVKKLLTRSNYSKVIFLGTYALVPSILSNLLNKKYKGKYWIDLRDLTYENLHFYWKLEKKVIMNSYKTVISSKGFLPFLPVHNYGFIHNIDSNLDYFLSVYKKSESKVIRIGYIGNISYYNSCKKVISSLANDKRFAFYVAGPNFEPLKRYCDENRILNVFFHGRFEREKTIDFYNNIDIVYNAYGNDSLNVRTASSNKLYYSARLELPILVSSNTYMEKICSQFGFSFSFNNQDDFADSLYEWFVNLKSNKPNYKSFWEQVTKEDSECIEALKLFLQQ